MTTLPNIDLHMNQLEDLQREILLVDAESLSEKKHLFEVIIKSHALLAEMTNMAKQNKTLEFFLNNISNALLELYQMTQATEDNQRLTRSREILQQLATTYQESMVPMLTRLHNLSPETDNMLLITSIASLGNEIITCSSQLYQFSDKIDTIEKIYAMLGTILMYAGIALSITILSSYAVNIPILASLTCIALGCILARLAMNHYKDLPEADLARTALSNIPTAIEKIEKDPQDQEYLQNILFNDVFTATVPKAPKAPKTPKPVESESKPKVEPTEPTLLEKMKSFMGFFKDPR